MNQIQSDSSRQNPTESELIGYKQVNPDSIGLNPNNADNNKTKSGHAMAEPEIVLTTSQSNQAEHEYFPHWPYMIDGMSAYKTYFQKYIKNPRTVNRWGQHGDLEGKKDPTDRDKWWFTEESCLKKLEDLQTKSQGRGFQKFDVLESVVTHDEEKLELVKRAERAEAKLEERAESKKELKDFILEIFEKQSALTDKKIEEAADRVRKIFVEEILKAVNVSRKTAHQLNESMPDDENKTILIK